MDRRSRDTRIEPAAIRVLIIAALAGMGIFGLDLAIRLHSPGHRFAEAMMIGYQRAMLADAEGLKR